MTFWHRLTSYAYQDKWGATIAVLWLLTMIMFIVLIIVLVLM